MSRRLLCAGLGITLFCLTHFGYPNPARCFTFSFVTAVTTMKLHRLHGPWPRFSCTGPWTEAGHGVRRERCRPENDTTRMFCPSSSCVTVAWSIRSHFSRPAKEDSAHLPCTPMMKV